jgi:GNAT superfamily N-acetyltransferase
MWIAGGRGAVLRLTPCTADDWLFRAALVAAGLPVDDLGEAGARYFGLSGAFGGFAGTGPDGLLRSVVVPAGVRGTGIGSALVTMIADAARGDGTERLWLLTSDAAGFFGRLGWRVAERANAPDAIRATAQFASLCPASATLMVRDL